MRDSTRRRSWALAELTRYTIWPRAAKNTAIGSRAGRFHHHLKQRARGGLGQRGLFHLPRDWPPWGSPCGGRPGWLSPASTRTVWALVIGKVDPDQPSVLHPVASLAVVACWRPLRRGGAGSRPRSQGRCIRRRHPLMCCNWAPTPRGRATSLIRGIRGIRGRPRAAIRRTRLSAPAPSSEDHAAPPQEPAGMRMQPWNLGAHQAPRSLDEDSTAPEVPAGYGQGSG
jgi:hypothetical protein